ncbi:hypothetical protein CC86DRAFT_21412 [Ophiobolus disseminans]|uniref:Uncharacterized protein n=1 Tax=Ophiobolus disseminans TaxID=1469910 RepID=A0A6A7A0S6_9PLEO|nr:hypothetical protein CC86DRAFT_21412 [Ophiobolus disseminans]
MIPQPSKGHAFTHETHTAFLEYKNQHELYLSRCFHEEHQYDDPVIITINERGNLCEDLPMPALTCREILHDLWGLIIAPDGQMPIFYAKIQNMDIFPFLRFVQMLKKHRIMDVTGANVVLKFKGVPPECSSAQATTMYMRKFSRVKRLIEGHWLQGVLLWHCLAGPGVEIDSDDEKSDMDPDPSISRFGTWMYSVRQNVALLRNRYAGLGTDIDQVPRYHRYTRPPESRSSH